MLFSSFSLLTLELPDISSLEVLIGSGRFLLLELFASYTNTIVIIIFEKEPYPKYIIILAQMSILSIKGINFFWLIYYSYYN